MPADCAARGAFPDTFWTRPWLIPASSNEDVSNEDKEATGPEVSVQVRPSGSRHHTPDIAGPCRWASQGWRRSRSVSRFATPRKQSGPAREACDASDDAIVSTHRDRPTGRHISSRRVPTESPKARLLAG